MFRLSTIGLVIFFCAALATITATAQTTSLKDSIAQQEQKLAQARASNNIRATLTELNILGSLYRTSGQLQKALDDLNEALPIEQQANSVLGQGTTLMTMGRVYSDMGQEDKALALLNQALSMWRTLGSRSGEAAALSYIGKVYNNRSKTSMRPWRSGVRSTIRKAQRPRPTAPPHLRPAHRRQPPPPAARLTSMAKQGLSTIWGAPTPTWVRGLRRSKITTRPSRFSARRASATAKRWC
jgi:tetratricopeptide (TPR) repeat protein